LNIKPTINDSIQKLKEEYDMFELGEDSHSTQQTQHIQQEIVNDIVEKLNKFTSYNLDEKFIEAKSRASSMDMMEKATIEGVDIEEEIDIGYSAVDLDSEHVEGTEH